MATNLRLQSTALVALLLLSYIGAPASAQEVQEDPNNLLSIILTCTFMERMTSHPVSVILMVKIQQVLLKMEGDENLGARATKLMSTSCVQ